jgi:hypothetical protein
MATRYYWRDTNADATCDYGADPRDLSKTQGTPTTIYKDMAGVTSFTRVIDFDMNVSGDTPGSGSYSFDTSISINAIIKCDIRYRIIQVRDSGCTEGTATGYSTTRTAAGTYTETLGPITWGATADRLRVSLEAQETATHATRDFTLDVNHASSYVDAPWPVAAGGVTIPFVARAIEYLGCGLRRLWLPNDDGLLIPAGILTRGMRCVSR